MTDGHAAQIYLVTPPIVTLDEFVPLVARLLDAVEIACLRLALATASEDDLANAADRLRVEAHARDVPLVIADHFRLARRLGLDGVHLGDGPRHVRAAREALGLEAIVGAHARTSRHDGMTAAEIGADYVSFGPVADTGLGDGVVAPHDLFEWWSEMIEVPVVAEGGFTPEHAAELAAFVDFIALGEEIWSHGDRAEAALKAYAAAIR
jgi:thiamine-phosphate pyrophosphorylase